MHSLHQHGIVIATDATAKGPAFGQRTDSYRPEIDGLRAFAVVAVIINHIHKDSLPSGYLGVDIFFVISGYVITASLAGRQSSDFGDFLGGFYARRIKRLVPALALFVLITSLFICAFNPDPQASLTTGLASLFGLSNLYLLRQATDYFAQSSALNPFTHTWSLGVEEQFYLVFPILIWFSGFGRQTRNGARNLFLWIGSLALASLIGFIQLHQSDQAAAYFLMPSRFWEMAAGCLIFIGYSRRAWLEETIAKLPPMLLVTAMVGVMLLPLTAQVPATIAIVVLAAMLIACLRPGTAAYALFSARPVVWVGLISYSLYLWHWGVLSISRWSIGTSWQALLLQVPLMVLLASLSYYLVETRLRQASWGTARATTLGKGLLLLVMASLGLQGIREASPTLLKIGGLFIGKDLISYNGIMQSEMACHIPKRSADPIQDCLGGAPGPSPTLFIIGDSHASNHYPSIKAAALQLPSQPRVRVLVEYGMLNWLHGIPGCGSFDPCLKDSWPRHRDFFRAHLKPGDLVIFSWSRDRTVVNADHLPRQADQRQLAILSDRLQTLTALVASRGARLLLVEDTPMVCEPGINYQQFVLRMGQWNRCSVSEQVSLQDRRGLSDVYKQIAADHPDKVLLYDPHPALCGGGRCDAFDRRPGAKPRLLLYGDGIGHFRRDYPDPLIQEWQQQLQRILPPS